MERSMHLTVNGKQTTLITDPSRSLLDVLREELHLTGTKDGCGKSECGACTVMIGDEAVRSCYEDVGDVKDRAITTIEGLSSGETLHAVQEAFLAEGALQCGYCTPGMIMRTVGLLTVDPRPSDENIISWMNPNICRCGAYPKIMNAIRRASRLMSEVTSK